MKNFTAFLAIITLATLTTNSAMANDYYSGEKWFSGTNDICYHSTSLAGVNIGSSSTISEWDDARSDWNDITVSYQINKSTGSCGHWVSASNYGDNGVLAYATNGNDWLGYVNDVDFSINTYYDYQTTSSCSEPYHMEYLARHELGHWAILEDVSDNQADTTMYDSYHCTKWDALSSHDESTIDSVY
jgi:hypothetical protein